MPDPLFFFSLGLAKLAAKAVVAFTLWFLAIFVHAKLNKTDLTDVQDVIDENPDAASRFHGNNRIALAIIIFGVCLQSI